MRNLKLLALTATVTVTLLGASFPSMAASSCKTPAIIPSAYGVKNSGSCKTAAALKNYGIITSGNQSGTTYSGCGTNAQSILDYLSGNTPDDFAGQTNGACKPGQDCSSAGAPALPGKPGNSGNSNSGSATTGSSQYAQQVVNLVNAERAKGGLNPVSVNTKVENAARIRAQEIVTSFSHTRPDGSNFSTALKAAGVSYHACGENIAYGQKSPEAVMNGWMNSSGHRANIMNPNFKYIGVGYYQTNGVNYWVQEFTY